MAIGAATRVDYCVLKTVLITGGAGFIGSNLTARYLQDGHRVICLDNLSSGDAANIAPFRDEAGFSFLRHDVCDPLPDSVEADEIYNLACPASPPHYQRDPVQTMRTCVVGAMNLLDVATRLDVPILQASTSEVYGDPEEHPQSETYRGSVNPVGPRACYNEGKRSAEALFVDFHRQHGTAIKIARIFNTYGPGMRADDGRVVSNFVVRALAGRTLEIYGSGAQTRSFCYVSDMVEGLIALMATDPALIGPVNLGSDRETDVTTLARLVLETTGSQSEIVRTPTREDDPVQRRPDLTLARQAIGWCPDTPLREGLERTVASFRASLAPT